MADYNLYIHELNGYHEFRITNVHPICKLYIFLPISMRKSSTNNKLWVSVGFRPKKKYILNSNSYSKSIARNERLTKIN